LRLLTRPQHHNAGFGDHRRQFRPVDAAHDSFHTSPDIFGRRAYLKNIPARVKGNPSLFGIPEPELFAIDVDGNPAGLSLRNGDPLKALQPFDGPFQGSTTIGRPDIDLYHLIPVHLSGISHIHGNGNLVVGRDLFPADAEIVIFKGGIRQAVSELIRNLLIIVPVGSPVVPPAPEGIIVEFRKVSYRFMPGDVQFSSRVYFAKEDFRHGSALCLAVVSRPDHSGDVWIVFERFRLYHSHGLHDHDGIRVHRRHSFYEFILVAGKGQGETVRLLPSGVLVGTHKEEDHIGRCGHVEGFLVGGRHLRFTVYQYQGFGTRDAQGFGFDGER